MSRPGFDPEILSAATKAQYRAADPAFSIFVEANAGSGKTRVLVDRVTRILLSDCPPDRILCVTYTKAAAAEMQQRLFARLGQWSVMDDVPLEKALEKLGRTGLAGLELAKARRLFARALETPGGLKIQTIHAFCENLLRRFPLEAGASPGFETLDDSAAHLVIDTARRKVLTGDHQASIEIALEFGGVEAIDNILRWARANRHAFQASLNQAGDLESLIRTLYGVLNLVPGISPSELKEKAWQEAPQDHLREAVMALQNHGSKTDQTRSEVLNAALHASSAQMSFDLYLQAFFTKKGLGSRAKSLITKTCAAAAPSLPGLFEAEADRLEFIRDQVRAASSAQASAAAIRIIVAFLEAYEDEMVRRRALDFDDLVRLAGDLLKPENAFSGWVGYKLDKTLSHALIDEAQDTAPAQWEMIRGLTAEFFAGKGVSEDKRTLFAVGDEKQSIYSFQGADPARFLAEGDTLRDMSREAGMKFDRPELDVSFRSSPEILNAVDQAFVEHLGEVSPEIAPETKYAGETPTEHPFQTYQTHRPARINTPGCVELWPAASKPVLEEENSIFDPVDAPRSGSSKDVLAVTIAREIKAMIDRGDGVWQEDNGQFTRRSVKASDIAILVWRRTGGFFEEMIRQLKLAGVPVAGADRMVLKDQTVVKDLLALARFGITPGDDLALAEILKSPFFDPDDDKDPVINDSALLDLVKNRRSQRRGTLWNALFTTDDPRFAEAREALADWRNKADTEGLYALFTGFLNGQSSTGESRWSRIFARLGEEARDPVEEFLSRAMKHEDEKGGALSSFLAAIDGDALQLKREMSTDRNEVQVMTVHASKGLERPVIILPDTTRSPMSGKGESLFLHPDAGLIWSRKKDDDTSVSAQLREYKAAKQKAEHGRLLYVALTRARDRLIVCGWRHGPGVPGQIAEDSWYGQLRQAWAGPDWVEFNSPMGEAGDDQEAGLRLGHSPEPVSEKVSDVSSIIEMPDWATRSAPVEAASLRPVAPSSLLAEDEQEVGIYSPLSDLDGHRYRRGELIHKLLETLPDLPQERRRQAAERFVAPLDDLSVEMRNTLVEETLGILAHPEFSALFGPGSRAEVGLVGQAPGLPKGVTVRGQVDRLLITDHEILIIDYKTNRPPPKDAFGVARVYLGQMAAYRALMHALHPGKTVRCALLWTDSAHLMTLPDDVLDEALSSPSA